MKKRGFTLAEVLITLGIIGVVAALTAPALVMSSRNEANAAKLSVVVSNLENALNNAIAQEGVDNLYGTRMWRNAPVTANTASIPAFVGNLGRYMVVNGYQNAVSDIYDGESFYPMDNTGSTNTAKAKQNFPGDGSCFPIELKNGAVIFMRTYARPNDLADQREAAINAGCTYYTNAADVYIDVNGKNAPNTYGRDIFLFEIGENGILYPVGGRDVARRDAEGGRWDVAGGRYTCTDESKGSDENQRGLGCTARVIAEGYKMNY